jgi:medium-chain acyl-[acyl-carrier-protein] hydrolase
VRALADGLAPALEGRFAFFGHSFGALVCFELARELRRRGRPLPSHLLVAARHAPQLPNRYTPLTALPDDELLEQLHRRYGYTRPEIDVELDELLQLMLPTVRADVLASERYVHAEEPPLPCPITAFGGLTDPTVTREELTAWRHQTAAGFEVRMLPGGHFFLETERTFLVRFVSGILLRAP